MTYSFSMQETFDSHRTQEDAFRYVADFSTIEQWDHTVLSSSKLSDGAVGEGTEFDLVLKFGPRKVGMHYRIIDYQFPNKVVLEGVNPGFTAIDTVTFNETPNGCHVDWRAELTFKGSLAKFAPRMESNIKKAGVETVRGLAEALKDENPQPQYLKSHQIADKLIWPGMWLFTKYGYSSAKKRWKPVTSNLLGKHVVLTGATSGLGLASAYDLAHLGARLTLVARNQAKAEEVKQAIIQRTGNQHVYIEQADMSLMADVSALADRLIEQNIPVDVLINNAGALFNPRQETSEGIEQSFALLLLSPFILTERLYPLLKAADGARVINVSSGGMYTQGLALHNIESTRGKYSGSVAYARAKRGLMISTEQWADKWAADNIVVHAMHPGWADTPGVASALPEFKKITQRVLRNSEEGADTITWLSVATEAAKTTGKFWLDREPHTTHIMSKTKEKPEQRQELRQILVDYASRFGVSVS